MDKAISIAFAALLVGPLIAMCALAIRRYVPYRNPQLRMECLYSSGRTLQVLAGELEPAFWGDLFQKLPNSPVQNLDLIFGPRLILTQKDFDEYIKPYTDKGSAPQQGDTHWLNCHPALRCLCQEGTKLRRLYLRLDQVNDVIHFSVGSNGTVFLEDPHGTGLPAGGRIYSIHGGVRKSTEDTFRRLVQDHEKCVVITASNASQWFSKIKFEIEEVLPCKLAS